MDYTVLDRARRQASPVQVDLVEAYAQGRVSRRVFVKRGTLIGLSVPFMGAIIAACGSSSKKAAPTTTLAPATTTASTTGTTTGATSGGTSGGTTPGTTATSSGAPVVQGGTIRVASQTPAAPLDPIAMADLGSYGVVAQCFEFLCTLGDTDIGPGLATSWTPNDDGSVWTFKLRTGVKWQNGDPFTSADVAATMDRLVAAKNAGLAGIIGPGAVNTSDPNTAVFTLLGPNGLFPYLVSVFNAQSLITPKGYVTGTLLDKQPDGTGPFKLTKYDKASGATFVRNDDWWGGKTPLDGSQWIFSDDLATQVAGVQGGAADAIVQFSVVGGDALLNDSNFNVIASRTSAHREIWMRCDTGNFTDKRVRQAMALSIDRDLLMTQLFKGKADIGNDHPIAPIFPFFDPSVPQRTKDIDQAKSLLAAAGKSGMKVTMNAPKLEEIPDLAALIQTGAKAIGVDITLNVESTNTFYDEWCKTYTPICDGGQEFGIVDYGHRAVPDVFLNAAYATGTWNSAHYKSDDFNAAFVEYQKALTVGDHMAACKKLETIANEDVPYAIPYFYNVLSGHTKKFTGVKVSALGQMFLGAASKTA